MERLSRQKLVELVRALIHDEEFDSDEEMDVAIEILKANMSDPCVIDYFFLREPVERKVDPVEVVDRSMAYGLTNWPTFPRLSY